MYPGGNDDGSLILFRKIPNFVLPGIGCGDEVCLKPPRRHCSQEVQPIHSSLK